MEAEPGRNPALTDIKVLDFSRVLAGPWAGQTLADLGATVIKVEAPGGDDTRSWGPPFIERDGDRSAAYFYACNRGKSSIVLDLTTVEGQTTARRLAADADVLIENFKVGDLARYGLDYAALSALNPRLVYCSITGFGQDGPYADRAGYDYLIQGMSGLMSITGDPGGAPQRSGVAITDLISGLFSVIGILAALRDRDPTGRGQQIDISLLDCAVAALVNQASSFFATGQAPGRTGNTHPSIVPYQVFPVVDGDIIIAAGNNRQYRKLCEALGRPDLATAPEYATNADRIMHRDALTGILSELTRQWHRHTLLAALRKVKVPAAPILSIAEVFEDPHVIARGARVRNEGVDGLRMPIRFSASKVSKQAAAPLLDQQGAEIAKGSFSGIAK